MSYKQPLPDDKQIPERVNGWVYDPDHSRNGYTWVGEDAERSVTAFRSVASARTKAYDDRASGFENNVEVAAKPDAELNYMSDKEAVWWAIKQAVDWMEHHHPTEWEHPDIVPAVFDAPPGFELAKYWMESRDQTVVYRQTNGKDALDMLGDDRLDSEPSLDTRKYIHIHTWNVSGKSTLSLAPWPRAHDHEMDEIVDLPEDCGLATAVQMAREWVVDQTDPLSSGRGGEASVTAR